MNSFLHKFSTYNSIIKGIKRMYFHSKPQLANLQSGERKHVYCEFAIVIITDSLYENNELRIYKEVNSLVPRITL